MWWCAADNADECFKFFLSAKAQMDAHTIKEHKDWEAKVEAAIKEKSLDDRLERPVMVCVTAPSLSSVCPALCLAALKACAM